MRAILIMVTACLLASCAVPRIAGSGKPAEPPGGWVEYCKRNPADPQC